MKLYGLARLGADAELRQAGSDSVCNLRLAYNFGPKDQSGKRATQWVDAALWGARAEALADYLVKGQQLMVEVRDVHVEEFTRSDGTVGTKLAGTVDNIEFGAPPPEGQGGGQQRQQGGQQRQQAPQGQQRQQSHQQQRSAPPQRQQQRQAPAGRQQSQASGGFDDMDDDIPF